MPHEKKKDVMVRAVAKQVIIMDLLASSKVISQEAAPIAYGRNGFSSSSTLP